MSRLNPCETTPFGPMLGIVLLSPAVILNEGLAAFRPISKTKDPAWPLAVCIPVWLCAQILGDPNGCSFPNSELSRVQQDVSSWHRYSMPTGTNKGARAIRFEEHTDMLQQLRRWHSIEL